MPSPTEEGLSPHYDGAMTRAESKVLAAQFPPHCRETSKGDCRRPAGMIPGVVFFRFSFQKKMCVSRRHDGRPPTRTARVSACLLA